MPTTTPEETAACLIAENFSIEQYEHIQEIRRARLKTFEGTGVPALIKAAQELVDFGEKVLKLMREANDIKT